MSIDAMLMGDLAGGAGDDIFNFNAGGSVTGAITDGAGDDTFNVSTALTKDLAATTGNDTFNLRAVLTGSITGGADDDSFILFDAGDLSWITATEQPAPPTWQSF